MILHQKCGLKTREFKIVGDNLKVKYSDSWKTKEFSYRIEDIGHKIVIETYSRQSTNVIVGIFWGFALFFTILFFINPRQPPVWTLLLMDLILIGVSLIAYLTRDRNEIFLIGTDFNLNFFLENPNKEKVIIFIDELVNQSKKLRMQKYLTFVCASISDLSLEEKINYLNWLKNNDLISELEFVCLKKDCKATNL